MKNMRPFILIPMLLGAVLAFQNCERPGQSVTFTAPNSNRLETGGENGQGYDGKVYVLMGEVCPDGTKLRSRILVKDPSNAELVRYECDEIEPVALTANDFQLNPEDPKELMYQNQIFVNRLVGAPINMALVRNDIGFCYKLDYDFGSPTDLSSDLTRSQLQVYEDGKPIGPAHADHTDIRNFGLGRYSHWLSDGTSTLRFSSSDNTNPLTNGRTYTWQIK